MGWQLFPSNGSRTAGLSCYESCPACLERLPGPIFTARLGRHAKAIRLRGAGEGEGERPLEAGKFWDGAIGRISTCTSSFLEAWPRAGESSVLWHLFWPRLALLAADAAGAIQRLRLGRPEQA
jgi:hypothetical protein